MILEEMFNGRFYPCETVVADSPRFKQAVKASAALMDTLSERLSKEDYALVEELREQGFFAAPGYGNFTSAYVWPCGWAGWGWPFPSYCWGF